MQVQEGGAEHHVPDGGRSGVQEDEATGEQHGVQQQRRHVLAVQAGDGAHQAAGQRAQRAAVADQVACHLGFDGESLLHGQREVAVVQHDAHGHEKPHQEQVPHVGRGHQPDPGPHRGQVHPGGPQQGPPVPEEGGWPGEPASGSSSPGTACWEMPPAEEPFW